MATIETGTIETSHRTSGSDSKYACGRMDYTITETDDDVTITLGTLYLYLSTGWSAGFTMSYWGSCGSGSGSLSSKYRSAGTYGAVSGTSKTFVKTDTVQQAQIGIRMGTNGSTYDGYSPMFTIPALEQKSTKLKVNDAWTNGKVWVKDNDAWYKAKKIYTKVNGVWEQQA